MKRVIGEQRLGFYATVSEDGTPNLSPKGSTYVWDDDRLFFANVRSPATVANIRRGSSVMEVQEARPLTSPAYDSGAATEEEIVRLNRDRFDRLHPRPAG